MDIKLPNLGDGIDSGTVLTILVKQGDQVTQEQPILELETDKAVAPIPSPIDGVIDQILVNEGDVIAEGKVIMKAASDGVESASDAPAPAPVAVTPASPAVSVAPVAPVPVAPAAVIPSGQNPNPVASPYITKLAFQIGLDLTRISGSGRGNRITFDDVRSYMAYLQQSSVTSTQTPPAVTAPTPTPKPVIDFEKWGPVRREKASSLRQKIASNLQGTWQNVPHVTQFGKVNITDLMALRKKYNPKYEAEDAKLTVTPFILKAIVAALKEFPVFNASYDESTHEIVYKDYFHLGVAVDTDAGLIVPVIRDVDQKSLKELAQELNELAELARTRKIQRDSLQGGCFTLSNLGSLGVGEFTPIVNSPELGILGVGMAEKVLYLEKKIIKNKLMMPLCLSYDHRIIDGGDGARFIQTLIQNLSSFDEDLLKEISKKNG